MLISMLAVLKSGGCYIPIAPDYPKDRIEYMLEDSEATIILTSQNRRNLADKKLINVKDERIYENHKENLENISKPEDLSYLIYTSGSTGTPKGVMLKQKNLSNFYNSMKNIIEYLKDGKNHKILSITTVSFDIFGFETLMSLTRGLTVYLTSENGQKMTSKIERIVKDSNVEIMQTTPSVMKFHLENLNDENSLKSLKYIMLAGEPLTKTLVDRIKQIIPNVTIYNGYGPSETTIFSTIGNATNQEEITIGRPINNTQIYILNKNKKVMPQGTIGELYISGDGVGKGYMNKEQQTNASFIINPFIDGKVMYKVGDLGAFDDKGEITCYGRIDNQVKIRGLRIELGEIENKMEQYPGVSAAIVNKITINDKDSLCGYYVTDGTSNISELEIKSYLKKYLPQYMVPSYIVHLEKMPYTINRKIDRKALPMPNIEEENFKEEEPDKYDNDELKLLQIWKNILHLDKINLNDNFFDIGGDSISAIKMQIEALKYNFNFEYADIFKYPTIKELASKKRYNKNNNIQKYDYSEINKILKRNNLENLKKIQKYNVKDVLLIGGTGYLGIHILYEYLKYENGKIYCLVRRKNNEEPLIRLQQKIAFYFGNDYYEKNKDRIQVVEGDIVEENLAINSKDYKMLKNNITTVINAGALVKHFGISKLFNDINVKGTENVVEFCKKENKRLIHISTISVSGNGEKEETVEETKENINSKKIFKESDLYIGQNISGIYTITKFEAEKIVLKAIKSGLNAQILRMGNITNRYSDGVFQQNVEENAFAKRLKSFIELGMFPKYLLDHAIELGPVDLCAEAVIKILEYDSNCNVLHIYNSKLLPIKLLVNTMKELGINIEAVDDETMSRKLKEILNDNFKKEILSGIIHDIDSKKRLIYTSNIRVSYDFSEKYLEKIGFSWKNIDREYILKYMNYFKGIGFIEY